MTSRSVSRWVRGFDGDGELRTEFRIAGSWTLARLRELVGADEEDPMFDSFAISSHQARILAEDAGKEFDPGDLQFFLEADSENL